MVPGGSRDRDDANSCSAPVGAYLEVEHNIEAEPLRVRRSRDAGYTAESPVPSSVEEPIPHDSTGRSIRRETGTTDIVQARTHGTARLQGVTTDWVVFTDEGGSYRIDAVDTLSQERTKIRILVGTECIKGSCSCRHYIADLPVTLKPCRFFCECFLMGGLDPDWEYLMRGVIFGFKSIDPDCEVRYDRPNYSRVADGKAYEAMNEKLQRELDLGRITYAPSMPDCVHGMFAIPKRDSDGMRGIVDCSKPAGASVNMHTGSVATHFSYNSVDDVVSIMEPGGFIAIIDIADAYRSVANHPTDRCRQGLRWDFGEGPKLLYDNRLCMGLSSSPYIFTKVSDFITRCAVRAGCDDVVNYLDDFAIVATSWEDGVRKQSVLMAIIRRLGFDINFRKLASPSRVSRFLGIEIDTAEMVLRLPADKMSRLLDTLRVFKNKRKATRRELERLGGLLGHCAKVVKGGRSFCSRIYDAIRSMKEPFYRFRLTRDFHRDIEWWGSFVERFNGRACILGSHAPHLSVYTDASTWGMGALHGSDWCVGAFDEEDSTSLAAEVGHHRVIADEDCIGAHINVLEMLAVLVAARRWCKDWADKNLVFVTDNQVVREALNSGKSKNKLIMSFVRELFWLSCDFNFTVSAVYIPSCDNTICDALSRWSISASRARVAAADPENNLCCSHLFH